MSPEYEISEQARSRIYSHEPYPDRTFANTREEPGITGKNVLGILREDFFRQNKNFKYSDLVKDIEKYLNLNKEGISEIFKLTPIELALWENAGVPRKQRPKVMEVFLSMHFVGDSIKPGSRAEKFREAVPSYNGKSMLDFIMSGKSEVLVGEKWLFES